MALLLARCPRGCLSSDGNACCALLCPAPHPLTLLHPLPHPCCTRCRARAGGVSASHLDVAPRHAGVVFGVGNTAGTLAGLLAVPGIGIVLERTGSWGLAFGLAAAHNVLGAILWTRWVGDRPLPEDGGDVQQPEEPQQQPQQQHAAALGFAAAAAAAHGAAELKLKAV